MQPSDIVVVTPVYKATLSPNEAKSIVQSSRILERYTRILVCPQSLDVSNYTNLDPALQIERFDDHYFKSIKSYNQLMVSVWFYKRFLKYRYMLIYQTDAWVFRDELLEWCQKGYDYIGAPWVVLPPLTKPVRINLSKLLLHKVGNGGFSLRNVSKHYYTAIFMKPFSLVFSKNEDFFWCCIVPKLNPFFKIPTMEQALPFAFELEPSACYAKIGNQLPFGCHAWEKYEPSFWQQFIPTEE